MCRDRPTVPFDETLLVKAAADLSRSYQERQTDQLADGSFVMSRSTDIVDVLDTVACNSSSNTSNMASSEVDVSHCREERTQQESADILSADVVNVLNGDQLKSSSESAADSDRKPTHSRRVVFRQRRSRSDETKTSRRRRKEFVSQDVVRVRRRRCRSLERRQSSIDVKHLRHCDAVISHGGRDRTGGDLGIGGTIRKSDSFDSGIDTKSDSTSPRTGGTDDVGDGGVNSRPDALSPPSQVQREVLSLAAAEVEYDRKATALVRCLDDDETELRQVLTSSASYRVATCYLCGVFDDVVRPLRSNVDDTDQCNLSVSEDSATGTNELKVSLNTGRSLTVVAG